MAMTRTWICSSEAQRRHTATRRNAEGRVYVLDNVQSVTGTHGVQQAGRQSGSGKVLRPRQRQRVQHCDFMGQQSRQGVVGCAVRHVQGQLDGQLVVRVVWQRKAVQG